MRAVRNTAGHVVALGSLGRVRRGDQGAGEVDPYPGTTTARSDRRWDRTATAPRLSRGSLPLPHLGDCTQAGHPSAHEHARTRSRVEASQVAATS